MGVVSVWFQVVSDSRGLSLVLGSNVEHRHVTSLALCSPACATNEVHPIAWKTCCTQGSLVTLVTSDVCPCQLLQPCLQQAQICSSSWLAMMSLHNLSSSYRFFSCFCNSIFFFQIFAPLSLVAIWRILCKPLASLMMWLPHDLVPDRPPC